MKGKCRDKTNPDLPTSAVGDKTSVPSKKASASRCCSGGFLSKAKCCLNKLWNESATPKERILAAASELFYQHGLHAVGVDAIAAAAETNKMTLYRHFGSKDELIAAYLRHLAEGGFFAWDKIKEEHPGDPKGQLLAWLAHVSPSSENGIFVRGCAFANAAAELPDEKHPGRKVVEEFKRKYHDMILTSCREAGLIDPEFLADELHLIFEGAVVSAQNLGTQGPAAHFFKLSSMVIDAHTP